jgi:hypothetical protein
MLYNIIIATRKTNKILKEINIMKTYSIQDKYNSSKVWLIKVYDCGEVYYNQEISGKKVNKSFKRTTKAWINELDINLNDRLDEEQQKQLIDSEEPEEYMGQDGTWHTFEDDHKEAYVSLFTSTHEEENNPYKNEDDDLLPF